MELSNLLAAVAGVLISLGLAYIPFVSERFDDLSGVQKRLVVGVLLVVAAGLTYTSGCVGLESYVPCDQSGLLQIGQALVFAWLANQGAYTYFVQRPETIFLIPAGTVDAPEQEDSA
jgi:hypothetical protein